MYSETDKQCLAIVQQYEETIKQWEKNCLIAAELSFNMAKQNYTWEQVKSKLELLKV